MKKMLKKYLLKKRKLQEFNQDLKLIYQKIQTNNKITDNKNNYGSQDYEGFKKIGSYKFSKLEDVNQLNFKPAFLNEWFNIF